jgi:chromosome segregation ATPase
MCKKLLFTAVIVAIGLGAFRYAKKHHNFGEEAPLAEQIRRERNSLPGLDAEIKRHISVVAQREVELKDLGEEIKNLEVRKDKIRAELSSRKDNIQNVKKDDKGNSDFQRHLRDLDNLAAGYKRATEELKAKKEQYDASKDALEAAHEELVAYQNERLALETQLAQLDAMQARMRVQEIKGRVHFDKSDLARKTKEIAQLRKKLEVRQKEIELRAKYLGSESVTRPVVNEKDVLDRVDELLGVR